MEDVMLNIMYDIPSQEGVKTCEITADTTNKIAPPKLIRDGEPQPKLPSGRKTRAKAAPAVKKAE
jgi:ATP-dependent protease Clp ATPase subunit